jgi:hypothetical protein
MQPACTCEKWRLGLAAKPDGLNRTLDKAFETVINLTREQLGVRGDVPMSKVANLGLLAEALK